MVAAENGDTDCLQLLLGARVDKEAKNNNGQTALMIAAFHGNAEYMSALLNAGVDSGVNNTDGLTALMLSAAKGHSKCLSLLIDKESVLDREDHEGRSALHHAAANGHSKCLSLLIDKESGLEVKNHSGALKMMAEGRRQYRASILQRMMTDFMLRPIVQIQAQFRRSQIMYGVANTRHRYSNLCSNRDMFVDQPVHKAGKKITTEYVNAQEFEEGRAKDDGDAGNYLQLNSILIEGKKIQMFLKKVRGDFKFEIC